MSSSPMEQLIATVNKLQDAFALLGYDPLNLPQICVVGGQSSGKSSVLENIVGRDFLPRGSGIVTRRPLVIQLIHSDVKTDYGVFLHKPNQNFTDFDEIRKEIVAATDEETGSNKGISDKSINLKVFSSHVLNLTLVDLPGITRVPVGDQPKDIEQQIRRMILKYITPRNAIVLAVTAANTDLSNSDALQLAREVDPEGQRTVGVITKVDIMDRGTNCMDVLDGQVIALRLGYVAVINRAQEDIDKNKKIDAQWKAEHDFFSGHPIYRTISERCGTPYLTKTLNRILIQHIRTCLPEIAAKIATFLNEKREEVGLILEISESTQRSRLVLRALTTFTDNFREVMDGSSDQVSINELFGGARIAYIFNQDFVRKVNKISCLDKFTEQEIRTTIRNCVGMRGGLFIPDQSFEVMIKRAIRALDEPCRECVQNVFEELATILSGISTPETSRFSSLHARIQEAARSILVRCLEPTKELVSTLIKMETSRINTGHPAFIGSRTAVGTLLSDIKKEVTSRKLPSDATLIQAEVPSALTPATPQPTPPPNIPAHSPAPPPPGAALQPPAAAPTPLARQASGKVKPGSGGPPPPPPPSIRKPRGTAAIDEPFSEQDAIETEVIRRLLTSYFDIVKTKIVDSVPKAVSLMLVTKVREELHDGLVGELYKEDQIDALLDENAEVAARRKRLREVIALLEASQKAISDVQSSSLL